MEAVQCKLTVALGLYQLGLRHRKNREVL